MSRCAHVSALPGMTWQCHRYEGHEGAHEAADPSPGGTEIVQWQESEWSIVTMFAERERRLEAWLGEGRGWRPITVAMYVPPDAPRRMVERWTTTWIPVEEGTDGVPH